MARGRVREGRFAHHHRHLREGTVRIGPRKDLPEQDGEEPRLRHPPLLGAGGHPALSHALRRSEREEPPSPDPDPGRALARADGGRGGELRSIRRRHEHPDRERKAEARGQSRGRRKGGADDQCKAPEGGHDCEDGEMTTAAVFRNLPIRQKLRRLVLIIAGVSVLGACAAFMTYQWFSSRSAMARQLEIVAEIVGDQSSAALEFGQAPQADTILRSLKAERQVVGAVLYGADGKVFARYLRDGAEADALPARASGDQRIFDAGGLLVTVPR